MGPLVVRPIAEEDAAAFLDLAELSFSPEADDLLVSASDERLLTALADALAEACDDDEELARAIESADHIE